MPNLPLRPHPAQPASDAPTPFFYVPLPHPMLADLRRAPAAIGAYALIARLFRLRGGEAVYLSSYDLMKYDPTLSEGTARRAFQILVKREYLAVAEDNGVKHSYIPTWGPVNDEIRPWEIGEPCLGRPRHVKAYRLDQRCLDLCIGVLEPHQHYAAKIERYVTTPLLGLREIGEYALLAAGYGSGSTRLEALGLIDNGRVRRLPDDDAILACASVNGGLSSRGWAQIYGASKGSQAPTGTPLFFVPPGEIAGRIVEGAARRIAGGIADAIEGKGAPEPLESRKRPVDEAPAGSHGIMNQDEGDETKDSPPMRASTLPQQGRDTSIPSSAKPQRSARGGRAPLPDSETVQLLRAVAVFPDVIREFMDDSLEDIAAAIAWAKAYPGARDTAALTVKALYNMRAGWRPPQQQNYPNQIAPRNDGPEIWERPEHDYLELAQAIMPSWALAYPLATDVQALASIIVEMGGDDHAALRQFAKENWERSGEGVAVGRVDEKKPPYPPPQTVGDGEASILQNPESGSRSADPAPRHAQGTE